MFITCFKSSHKILSQIEVWTCLKQAKTVNSGKLKKSVAKCWIDPELLRWIDSAPKMPQNWFLTLDRSGDVWIDLAIRSKQKFMAKSFQSLFLSPFQKKFLSYVFL